MDRDSVHRVIYTCPLHQPRAAGVNLRQNLGLQPYKQTLRRYVHFTDISLCGRETTKPLSKPITIEAVDVATSQDAVHATRPLKTPLHKKPTSRFLSSFKC